MRVTTDGKQFRLGDERFRFCGVTYGTFRPRTSDGARFPERTQLKQDFAAMSEAEFTVVRTYTEPPADLLEMADEWDLKVLAGIFYPDWRYLVGCSRRQQRRVVREAAAVVSEAVHRLSGTEAVLAVSLGNEIPADVVRWVGAKEIASALSELTTVVRNEDPGLLVTYANYPTAEYLDQDYLDFLTVNVFLERRREFGRYLRRLQHLAGDRPLVLGEMGLDAGTTEESEETQAGAVDWQREEALEQGVAGTCVFSWTDEWWVGDRPVEGWHFGLTRADRSPRPALEAAARWNRMTVADLRDPWPSMSVVVCAYNAAATLDECLSHTCSLDYPDLEIIVVDDGSTDDTAAIAGRHPRARLVPIPHAGLSVARNEGFRAASGEIVAYLDSDAYPSTEWPYYLALGMEGVHGAGGPNVPPRDDPVGAQQVALAPGGPVHVLLADDRAEHIPGCNMAFRRRLLEELGGFDPIFTSAGDDVDFCWRVLDRGNEIGFHPAALVWHHRRPGLRTYLRQQRGYGRAEALVESRHPERFTPVGSARWRGSIYQPLRPALGRQRVYHGLFGAAAYQSVYRDGGHLGDILHQAGVPASVIVGLILLPLTALVPPTGIATAVVLVFLLSLFGLDMARADPPRHLRSINRVRFRAGVGLLHLLQPLVRTMARAQHARRARREGPPSAPLTGPVRREGRVLVMPAHGPRAEVAAGLVSVLRRAGYRLLPPSAWEDHDVRVLTSLLWAGDVVSSAYPEGCIQVRVRPRARRIPVAVVLSAAVVLGILSPWLVLPPAVLIAADCSWGAWQLARRLPAAMMPSPG